MIIKENYSLNNYGAIKFYQKFQDLNLIMNLFKSKTYRIKLGDLYLQQKNWKVVLKR